MTPNPGTRSNNVQRSPSPTMVRTKVTRHTAAMPIKLVPWLLTGVLLVVAKAIASAIPKENSPDTLQSGNGGAVVRVEPALQTPAPTPSLPQEPAIVARQPEQGCQSANSAVVTIHAGRAFGSGSIVSPDGLVITNNHVIRPSRTGQVTVRTADGARFAGQVTAVDPVNDLALIQLEAQANLPTMRLGDPQTVQIGEKVCAIGSPFGRPGVLTRGTITTVRQNGDLQSALLLEPGNSGGPLLNERGEMIGINKAIWQSRSGVNSGISFATNIEIAKSFIQQNGRGAIANATPYRSIPQTKAPSAHQFNPSNPGSVVVPSEPFTARNQPSGSAPGGAQLGVVLDKETLVVQQVDPASVASMAGLQAGDRLVAINGAQLQGFDQLQQFLSNRPSAAVITVDRNQQTQTLQINF